MERVIPNGMRIVRGKPEELLEGAKLRGKRIASNVLVDYIIHEKPEVLSNLIEQFAKVPENVQEELADPRRRMRTYHPENPDYWRCCISDLMTRTIVAFGEGFSVWNDKDRNTTWIITRKDEQYKIRYGTIWVCEDYDIRVSGERYDRKVNIVPSKVDVYPFGETTHVHGDWYLPDESHMLPLGPAADESDPRARRLAFGIVDYTPRIKIVYRTISGIIDESGRWVNMSRPVTDSFAIEHD